MIIANYKKLLHVLIDGVDKKRTLYHLEKEIFPYVIKYRTKQLDEEDKNLTEAQKLEMKEVVRQVEGQGLLTLEEFEKRLERHYPGLKDRIKNKRKKEEEDIKNSSRKKLRKKLHSRVDTICCKHTLKVLLKEIMPASL